MPRPVFGAGHTFEHEGNEMKKVLLASTALVMTAGMGYAQVSTGIGITGYAEIGFKDMDTDADLQFHNDFDLSFNLSGETDGGVAFGAKIDLDEVSNGIDDDSSPASAFVAYNGFRLDMGDVDGALDMVNLETTFLTTLEDDHTIHAGFFDGAALDGGLDGQIATLSYTGVPGLLLAVSAELGDSAGDTDEIYGVGIRYTTDIAPGVEVSGSLAYQEGAYDFDLSGAGIVASSALTSMGVALSTPLGTEIIDTLSGDAEIWAISLELELDAGFTGRVNYADLDGTFDTVSYDTDNATLAGIVTVPQIDLGTLTTTTSIDGVDVEWDFWSVGLLYETGPWGFEANYGEYDATIGGVAADADGFGLAVNYDLGGGAALALGYGSGEGFFSSESVDTWSFGMFMNF